jgi:hypothetical protein
MSFLYQFQKADDTKYKIPVVHEKRHAKADLYLLSSLFYSTIIIKLSKKAVMGYEGIEFKNAYPHHHLLITLLNGKQKEKSLTSHLSLARSH